MLKRKIFNTLVEWKEHKDKECLLIKGARQVGKTFIVDEFSKEYGSYIKINFIENPEYKEIFDGDISAVEIYKKMSLKIPNIKFIKNDTLIFLDEIQECPNARTALKFLAIDNSYDIIASGSLLGINYKGIASIPVGYEKQIEMFSLDFEEFLWAIGIDKNAIENLKEYFDKKEKVPFAIHESMMKYLREYITVGGMPEVVKVFVETNNFRETYDVQKKIIDSYLDDIYKYASTSEKLKVKNVYLSIPKQLAKPNKKFQFSFIEKKATSRKYENSIEWLRDASLVSYCNSINNPIIPLSAYTKDNFFKIYLNDVGLLTAMYGFEIKDLIISDKLHGDAKGGIYENFVADTLTKKGYDLFYFKNEGNTQEIEFLITKESSVVPIEVKANNGATISLNEFLKRDDVLYGYKFISGNIGVVDKKITLPLYMALFI